MTEYLTRAEGRAPSADDQTSGLTLGARPLPWRMIHGDALEAMAGFEPASFDAVITDPPYCSGGFTEQAKRQARGMLPDETLDRHGWFINDNMGTAGLVWLLRTMAVRSFYLLRDGGALVVFLDWRMWANLAPALESSGLRLSNMLVWAKPSPGMGQGFRAQHELAAVLSRGVPRYYAANVGNLLDGRRIPNADRFHQTEKPQEVMRPIVEVLTPAGGRVLDPFAGSGSTGVAALEAGREFVGIEWDAANVEVARRRLEGTAFRGTPLDQGVLFQ